MSLVAIAATVGTVSTSSGKTVTKVLPTEVNSAAHVQVNPDSNRILMKTPGLPEYTSVPSVTQGTTTIILEPA